RIATVSAGYADGYPRALSSRGNVLIRGRRAPILGRVCMDQMMVDVTDIPDVQIEDVVTLIGHDGDAYISVEEVADPAGRFNYEMLCDISPRVTRRYI
ncbi:MAG: alanine racemase, partial [Eubacterium sp.]|nr:alanine racemase [Eubacterium sp.]